jgi:hypothetical protein
MPTCLCSQTTRGRRSGFSTSTRYAPTRCSIERSTSASENPYDVLEATDADGRAGVGDSEVGVGAQPRHEEHVAGAVAGVEVAAVE